MSEQFYERLFSYSKMATWTKIQPLLPQIQSIYDEHFPLDVRFFLAEWIEAQNWFELKLENPSQETTFAYKNLLLRFIAEIQNKIATLNDVNLQSNRLKLLKLVDEYKAQYEVNSIGLFNHIRNILMHESNVVQTMNDASLYVGAQIHPNSSSYAGNHFPSSDEMSNESSEGDSIPAQILQMKALANRLAENVEKYQRTSSAYLMQCNRLKKAETEMYSKYSQNFQQANYELKTALSAMLESKNVLLELMNTGSSTVSALVRCVIENELIAWKREQQLAGNGCEFKADRLNDLQGWCEEIAEVAYKNLTMVKEAGKIVQMLVVNNVDVMNSGNILLEMSKRFTENLTTVVLNSFILEKQPPQVMKTNTRFTAKIRFLIGPKLGVCVNPPVVKVSIVSETQANGLLLDKKVHGEASGEILNNTGTMEYDKQTNQFSITFRNMQLKKIKRAEKKGSESVVDEKFALFFSSKFSIGHDLEFLVWTMSLPVTVIVHGNQEPHAWATITWDNAFAETGRRPFVVPDKVHWGKVANALDVKFKSITGRGLSTENLKYLAEKLFRSQEASKANFDTTPVSWAQFSKESLVERNFTFWDWFYAIMKLTKEHLRPLWTDGSIHGFLRKKEAESMLSTCPIGTFLLRFSDSELGGITIAWVCQGALPDEPKRVCMLQPFTAKDFAIRSLADRLNDLHQLLYLYPEIPKNTAFGKHYSPVNETQAPSSNGYVKPLLVTTVPGVAWPALNNADRMNGYNSYPATPIVSSESPDTPSTMSEPIGGSGGWPDTFVAMDYENIPDFPDFGSLPETASLPDGPSRALDNY